MATELKDLKLVLKFGNEADGNLRYAGELTISEIESPFKGELVKSAKDETIGSMSVYEGEYVFYDGETWHDLITSVERANPKELSYDFTFTADEATDVTTLYQKILSIPTGNTVTMVVEKQVNSRTECGIVAFRPNTAGQSSGYTVNTEDFYFDANGSLCIKTRWSEFSPAQTYKIKVIQSECAVEDIKALSGLYVQSAKQIECVTGSSVIINESAETTETLTLDEEGKATVENSEIKDMVLKCSKMTGTEATVSGLKGVQNGFYRFAADKMLTKLTVKFLQPYSGTDYFCDKTIPKNSIVTLSKMGGSYSFSIDPNFIYCTDGTIDAELVNGRWKVNVNSDKFEEAVKALFGEIKYTDIQGTPDLSQYYLKTEIDSLLSDIDYADIKNTPDLSGFATKDDIALSSETLDITDADEGGKQIETKEKYDGLYGFMVYGQSAGTWTDGEGNLQYKWIDAICCGKMSDQYLSGMDAPMIVAVSEGRAFEQCQIAMVQPYSAHIQFLTSPYDSNNTTVTTDTEGANLGKARAIEFARYIDTTTGEVHICVRPRNSQGSTPIMLKVLSSGTPNWSYMSKSKVGSFEYTTYTTEPSSLTAYESVTDVLDSSVLLPTSRCVKAEIDSAKESTVSDAQRVSVIAFASATSETISVSANKKYLLTKSYGSTSIIGLPSGTEGDVIEIDSVSTNSFKVGTKEVDGPESGYGTRVKIIYTGENTYEVLTSKWVIL